MTAGTSFVPFRRLPSAEQQRLIEEAAAPEETRSHVEPVLVHSTDASRPPIGVVHLQVRTQHVMLTMGDVQSLQEALAEAERKLAPYAMPAGEVAQ